MMLFQQEVAAFPEYYAQYFKDAMMGGAIVPLSPVVCVGPVKYRGEKLLQTDIANVKAAAKAAGVPDDHVFLPATAPSGVGINEYYKSDEEYFHALAAELNKEYKAIVDAGILVQIDDPFLPDIFFEPGLDDAQKKRRAEIYVEATNAALKGIPPDMVRFHTCYGINEGPRLYEAASPTSSTMCSRSTPAPTVSKPPTRATSTNITCSSASRCRRARCCARASSPMPAISWSIRN